jgi:hypothetical protein
MEDKTYKVRVRETRVVEVEYTIEAKNEEEALEFARMGNTMKEEDIRVDTVEEREAWKEHVQLAPPAPEGQQMFEYVVGRDATQYFKAEVPFSDLNAAMEALSQDGLECSPGIEWDGSNVSAFDNVECAEIIDPATGETLAEYDNGSWDVKQTPTPGGP